MLRHATSGKALLRMRRSLPSVALILGLLIVWEFGLILTDQPSYRLPPFRSVVWLAIARSQELFLPNAWVTLQEVMLGFALAATTGVSIGVLIFYSRVIRRAAFPVLVASQAIPVIAVAPLLIIWFGYGMSAKVVVAAVISFFPVVINTVAGLDASDKEMVRLMQSLGAGKFEIFRKVRFPAALPLIFAGWRTATAICVIGAIVGEWVGAYSGLGPVMIAAHNNFRTDIVFAAILYASGMGVSLFGIVTAVERAVIPWHYGTSPRRRGRR